MKYHSRKVTFGGKTFDSTRERDRYGQLLLLQRAGKIRELETQKYFELIPRQTTQHVIHLKTKDKIVERVDEQAVGYHCDFFYYDIERQAYIVEEVKSPATARIRDYPLRRKLIKLRLRTLNAEAGYTKYIFNQIGASK